MLVVWTVVVVRARLPSTLYVFSPVIAVDVTSLTTNVTDVAAPAPAIDAVTVTGPGAAGRHVPGHRLAGDRNAVLRHAHHQRRRQRRADRSDLVVAGHNRDGELCCTRALGEGHRRAAGKRSRHGGGGPGRREPVARLATRVGHRGGDGQRPATGGDGPGDRDPGDWDAVLRHT